MSTPTAQVDEVRPCRDKRFFNLRVLIGLLIFFTGVFLALFARANPQALSQERPRDLRVQVHRSNRGPFTSSGNVQEAWVARYNGSANGGDGASAIAIDGSGNVYVTGVSWGDYSDYATIKYNSAGQQQWVARYDGPGNRDDVATAIAVDSSGNVYVTGGSTGSMPPGFGYDYATIKYDSAGAQQWVARYGLVNTYDEARAIAVDASGNVYVTGLSPGLGTGNDYATIKYDSAGQQQWVSRYNGPGNSDDSAFALAIDSSGNVYVTGQSAGLGTGTDYATIKYNSAGQEQWVVRYNGSANGGDGATAIVVDSSGNVYVTGESGNPSGDSDYLTIKYDASGAEQWVARYNGPGDSNDGAIAIAIDSLGNVYVTGDSVGVGTGTDYATIKYNSAGQQQWAARYNGPANLNDYAHGIAIDASGNVYVTGASFGSGSYDYATIKYVQAGTPTPTPSATPTATATPTPTSTPRVTPTPRSEPTPRPRPTPPPRPTP
jgi:uncharacterized delta-60 repeat protein